MATPTVGSIFTSSPQFLPSTRSVACTSASPSVSSSLASSFTGTSLRRSFPKKKKVVKTCRKVTAAATVVTSPTEEIKEYGLPLQFFVSFNYLISDKNHFKNRFECDVIYKVLHSRYVRPSWAMFELGRAPVYWKTMNGLPPMSGEKLKVFYNPAANRLVPNEEFGIGFNGGFNQPFMCGGEPRAMLKKTRGQNDAPFYTIQICIPKHAVNLIFSFTNGDDWDGPYRLQFQVPKGWRNKPMDFFNKGLAEDLSKEGACDRVIFPDTDIVVDRCALIGNLNVEGGDRCDLNLVPGCMDPNAPEYNPLANVDDGSCLIDPDS
ncbi:hypothetical protein Ddye_011495 [Dipteronia dyeriana]|uniref:PIFI-like Ig-like domain-containing protein n=1 Tax=Dipteronia dyeriana TaxID=168575 RepID=A0AAE0CH17_9ROSI|nr:hypothetical protein Ddye_011495 [Dipteronia dyeriana]